jgi:hypothetical protein
MKKLVLLLILSPYLAFAQYDCDNDNHTAVGISYILPKSISAEAAYFTNIGLTAGIGGAYTVPAKTIVKNGANEINSQTNMFDIFAYAGYRILHVDYKVSAFLNAGGTMGDVNSLQPFVSAKVLFPSGQKAFSFEPFYIFNRGISGRATIYFKL